MIGLFGGWLCLHCGYFNVMGKRCVDCGAKKP